MDKSEIKISRQSGVAAETVWISLQKGSLIVRGGVQDSDGAHKEPTDDEVRVTVREVQQGQMQVTEQQTPIAPTATSRVRTAHDPLAARYPWLKERDEVTGARSVHTGAVPQNEEASASKGIRLVTKENLNVQNIAGEQDKNNKFHYTKLAKQMTDYIGPKGSDGIQLVAAMKWAVAHQRAKVTDSMVELSCDKLHRSGDIKQLHLLVHNWTEGQADRTISYEVLNGIDAWRKLHYNQLPEIDCRKQILMQSSNNLTIANNVAELKDMIQAMERITSLHADLASANFHENQIVKAPDAHPHRALHIHSNPSQKLQKL